MKTPYHIYYTWHIIYKSPVSPNIFPLNLEQEFPPHVSLAKPETNLFAVTWPKRMRSPEQCKDERLLQATLSTESSLLITFFNLWSHYSILGIRGLQPWCCMEKATFVDQEVFGKTTAPSVNFSATARCLIDRLSAWSTAAWQIWD